MTGHQTECQPLGPNNAPWLFDGTMQEILAFLNEGDAVTRVVGGAVRNTLMGMPVSDIDLATTLLPQRVIELGRKRGYTVVETGVDHGTVTLLAGPHGDRHSVEVTTLRADVETHGRHATVAFTDDWAGDAARRDFTINAIYCDADGTLYDPVAGTADIKDRKVRFVGDAGERIAEDYLRILRFFRFTAQYSNGVIEKAGLAACVAGQEGIAQLSHERIRQELFKLLPAPGVVPVIDIMATSGILARIGGEHRPVDIFRALVGIESAQHPEPQVLRRLAALFLSDKNTPGDLQARLRLSRSETKVLESIEQAPAIPGPRATEHARRLLLYRCGVGTYCNVVLLAWAGSEAAADDAGWSRSLGLPTRWVPPEFPLAGRDIVEAGIPSGPRVGQILGRLEQRWIDGGFVEDRAALLALLPEYL